jgi:hypothetical protein
MIVIKIHTRVPLKKNDVCKFSIEQMVHCSKLKVTKYGRIEKEILNL